MSEWTAADLLPGLWVAALGAGLAWALRRGWDAVPGRVWALFAAVVAALFWRALFCGGVAVSLPLIRAGAPWQGLDPSPWPVNWVQWDPPMQFVPWLAAVRRAFAAGEWPLWNAGSGAGMPLLADPQAQALQPFVALASPLPLAAALGATAAFKVLVALAFTFLFLRRQGAGEAPAAAGALAFGMSGYLLHWMPWPHSNAAALLPVMLYALAVSADRGARRDLLLVAGAAAALALAGHPETMLYAGALAGAYALARLWKAGRPEPSEVGGRGRRWGMEGVIRLATAWAGATALAFGLAAPGLLPAADLLPTTVRQIQADARAAQLAREDPFARLRTVEARAAFADEAARRLVPIAAPNAYGNDRLMRGYWGQQNINEDATGFAGTAVLLAALLALWPRRGGARLPHERVTIAVAAVALPLLVQVPGLWELSLRLPVLGFGSSGHRRALVVIAFAAAALAAATVERWRRGELPRWAGAAVAAPLAGLLVWAYRAHPGSAGPKTPPSAEMTALLDLSLAVQLAALAAAAAIFALRPKTARGRAAAAAALLAAVGGELLILHGPINPPAPRRLFYPETGALAALRERATDWRIVASGHHFVPNSALVAGLADLRASTPVKPWDYARLVVPVLGSPFEATDRLADPDHPLLDLFGVRFALTPPLTRLAPPWIRSRRGRDAWIWRRPTALRRLFLPAAALAQPGDGIAWMHAETDFAARAIVAPEALPAGAPWAARDPGGATLADLRLAPHRLRAEAVVPERRLLVASVYGDGGWRLLVDGVPAPTFRADAVLLGAWIEPGAHRLELLYRPPAFLAGLVLAALALAAAAAWGAAPRRRGGPSRTPPE